MILAQAGKAVAESKLSGTTMAGSCGSKRTTAPEAIPAVPETTPTVPAVDEAIPPSDGDETTGNHPMMLAEGGVGTAGSLGTGPGGFFQGASL